MTETSAPPAESAPHRKLRLGFGIGLSFMGVLHVLLPGPFLKIIPKGLGAPRFWNLVAAAAEGGSGALLLSKDPRKQQLGGALATATIIGVYPANINMAIDAGAPTSAAAAAAWLRLPFQFPMILGALRLAKGER